jgi:hypothetical protein
MAIMDDDRSLEEVGNREYRPVRVPKPLEEVRDLHRVEQLLYSRPDVHCMTRFVHARLATLLKKGLAVGSQGIPGEKQHSLAQVDMLLAQPVIELDPIESWHTEIAQHDVIAMLVQLPQGKVPIGCRVDRTAIMAE